MGAKGMCPSRTNSFILYHIYVPGFLELCPGDTKPAFMTQVGPTLVSLVSLTLGHVPLPLSRGGYLLWSAQGLRAQAELVMRMLPSLLMGEDRIKDRKRMGRAVGQGPLIPSHQFWSSPQGI